MGTESHNIDDVLDGTDAAGPEDARGDAQTGEPRIDPFTGLNLDEPIEAFVAELFNPANSSVPSSTLDDNGTAQDDTATTATTVTTRDSTGSDTTGAAPDEPAQAGGADESGAGGAPEPPPAPDSPSPEPPSSPSSPRTYNFRGVEFTEDQVLAAIATAGQLQSLPPQVIDQFNRYLAGDYELVPRGTIPAPQAGQGPADLPPSGQSAPSPVVDPTQVDWEDPDQVRAAYETLYARVDQTEALARQQAYMQAQAENEARLAAVNQAVDTFSKDTGITDPQLLEQVQMQAVPLVRHIRQTNPALAPVDVFKAALEQAAWTVPAAREVILDREAKKRIDESQNELAEARARKARNAALAGSPSGSLPRQVPAPDPRKQTQAQRDAQMLAVVQSWMNGNTPTGTA